jgi:4-hydroxy-tetrahydrodipicolinate reductase
VTYESALDIISLGHSAKSREAFAAGALMAAAFLPGKKGIFGMKDLLNI